MSETRFKFTESEISNMEALVQTAIDAGDDYEDDHAVIKTIDIGEEMELEIELFLTSEYKAEKCVGNQEVI
jgi:hypothetical protein